MTKRDAKALLGLAVRVQMFDWVLSVCIHGQLVRGAETICAYAALMFELFGHTELSALQLQLNYFGKAAGPNLRNTALGFF